jgi:GR25 family glycosyltransferase involved in LPS biosynthesis
MRPPRVSWSSLLQAPAFCINLERRVDRRDGLLERLQAAGFSNASIWPAVDARQENLEDHFAAHGLGTPLDVDRFTARRGSQGSLLSHLSLLAHAIHHQLAFIHIFEDDVIFPSIWQRHARSFYAATPADWDILFLGAQIEYRYLPWPSLFCFLQRRPRLMALSRGLFPRPAVLMQDIVRCPLFCTHAYTLSLEGCRRLYHWLTHQPVVYGYDFMIYDGMRQSSRVSPFNLNWYAWNSLRLFPKDSSRGSDPAITQRNRGLIFQQEEDPLLAPADKL